MLISLAPMDGVTDAAFRFMVDTHSQPDSLYTEFTSVEGIVRGAEQLLQPFIRHTTQTPTIAQIFGAEPDAFYAVAILLCEMGFQGIDINMGCPDKNVAKRGGGAGLIRTPDLAQEIVRKTKQGVQDWTNGKNMQDTTLPENIIAHVESWKADHPDMTNTERTPLPVSVKTRMGYDTVVTEDWMKTLLETKPVTITLHGRTLKQMYTGQADWEEIGKAARVVKQTSTRFFGNGDITSMAQAHERIEEYGLDGVLVGRATFGNPWFFQKGEPVTPTVAMRFHAMIEHSEAFEQLTPNLNFLSVRKHLGWYCKGFPEASRARIELMKARNLHELKTTIELLKLSYL